jgi:CheY-like chemotaxis protein
MTDNFTRVSGIKLKDTYPQTDQSVLPYREVRTLVKILVVDDDEVIRFILRAKLEENGFDVTTAGSVSEALKRIHLKRFDVLLSDLHMPGAGDGLTVVSAMRHSNPEAITLLLSAFPEMNAAAQAILLQADEILVKTMDFDSLVTVINQRLASGLPITRTVETIAAILERSALSAIQEWYGLVQKDAKVMAVALSEEKRCSHLPQVFRDLISRLFSSADIGSKELISAAAVQHGIERRRQGYTAAMMVEESRMLQVTIFHTLQKNLATVDYSALLGGVMTIADEVDSQLSQAMTSYIAESVVDALPA